MKFYKPKVDLHPFYTKWNPCERCNLSSIRKVHWRGYLPADVLFVGEAPGHAEDLEQLPFVGPAGDILDHVIESAQKEVNFSWAITNTVACLPRDPKGGTREPTETELAACRPRLFELFDLAKPKLVVGVGLVSMKEFKQPPYQNRLVELNGPKTDSANKISLIYIPHPAFILRLSDSLRAPITQKAISAVVNALEKLS